MRTDKHSLPPLDMPPPAGADADAPAVKVAALPAPMADYALAAAMGRQLSEPLGNMQDIVQALLGTGKISRRKVQMLVDNIARVRRLSMQSQQLLRLTQGALRQSHERLRLDMVVRQALEGHTAALHAQGVELVQRIRHVEVILDPGMVSSLVEAAIDCATIRGSRLLVTLEVLNWPEHALLTFKTLQTVVTHQPPTPDSGIAHSVAWSLLCEIARASSVILNLDEIGGNTTLSLEFPRTVRQLEGLTMPDMENSDDSLSHMDSKMVSGQRILLVSSDDALGHEVSRICAHMGLVLDVAVSSILATRHCEMDKPQLVIFDERDADATFQELRQDLLRLEPGFPLLGIADDANTLAMSSWMGDSIARVGRSVLRTQLPQVLALELTKAL